MVKIVVNARFLTQKITGVQRYGIEISLKLKDLYKDNIIFVTPSNIEQSEYAKLLDAKVVGVHTGHLWEQWDLVRFLKKNNSPLLLNFANTAPLFYKNKIVTVHDVAFDVYPQTFGKLFLYSYKFMIPRIMKTAKHIITVSNFSKSEICKYHNIDQKKITVVYCAPSKDKFYNLPDDNLNKKQYLLGVSSINYRKNFIGLLQAFEIASKQNRKMSLFVIGDISGSNFRALDIEKYKNNANIRFCGRVSDGELVKYYSNAVGFVFPSFYEGFGLPPLEAQLCKIPVIAAHSSSLPEVLGDSVLYCDAKNVSDIAEKMLLLYSDSSLRKQLEGKGIANVERFSWANSANQFKQIIEKFV